jgi:hypothetical protein
MSKKTIAFLVTLLLVAGLFLAAGGCGKKGETGESTGANGTRGQSGETSHESPGPARTVTMNGRSVMELWMKQWGFKWEGPVEKNGYFFDYKELDGNDMAPSFAKNVEGLAPGSATFFKFCFADFDGSNLSQREKEVEKAIETARARGLKLIIGNALPVRKSDGSPEMIKEYKEYNDFLLRKAQENQGVWIFDFYGVLAGPDGWLKPEYQTEDSHPNDKAFTALDRPFFELLDTVFAI